MFDFAWSEMAVIAVVALIAIGPKDMPVALKAFAATIKKARRMASEFQTHVDEMMREANLEEVRQSLNEIRNFDVSSAVEKHVDPDHSLRDSLSDPFSATVSSPAASAETEALSQSDVAEMDRPAEAEAPRRRLRRSFLRRLSWKRRRQHRATTCRPSCRPPPLRRSRRA